MALQATVAFLFPLILLTCKLPRVSSSDAGTSPQFSSQPSNIIAALGGEATFQCDTTGFPQPSVTWFKNGESLELDTRITQDGSSGPLRIGNVESTDAGEYFCVASNAVGSVRSLSAHLQIASFGSVPTQSTQLMDVVRLSSLVLDCMAPTSIPKATISWSHDGDPVEVNTSEGRIGVTLDGTLVISLFKSEDTGITSCLVANSVTGDSVTSIEYVLSEDSSSPANNVHEVKFEAVPQTQTAVAGDSVKLECFTTGSPVASITWEKDDAPLPGHIQTEQAGRVISIAAVSMDDAGSYKCTATQVLAASSTVKTATAELSITVPPTITQSFAETPVLVTQPAVLTCQAEGSPTLQWQWRKDGELVDSSLYGEAGMVSMLSIAEVSVEDGGVYQCVVENMDIGIQSAANELLVAQTQPPSFTHGTLRDALVFTHSTVVLPCTATGFPPPVFSWTRGMSSPVNVDLEPRYSLPPAETNNGSLTIEDAQIADSSSYVCIAVNTVNMISTGAVNLRVIESPDPVTTPETSVPDPGAALTLECSVGDLSGQGITVLYVWTKDSSPYCTNSSGNLNFNNIQTSNNGNYTCSVRLSVSGNNADPLVVRVGSAIITVGEPPTSPSPPLNPTFSQDSITNSTLTAHWDTPTSDGNLTIISYEIQIRNLGRSNCPSTNTNWSLALTVPSSGTGTHSAVVPSLAPYTEYQFRVVAINSGNLRSSASVPSHSLQTAQSVPSAPPTMVQATPNTTTGDIAVAWQPPADCSTHNGILIDYIITYSAVSGLVSSGEEVAFSQSHSLTNLQSESTYEIRVAARTSIGRGPFSEVVMATSTVVVPMVTNTPPTGGNLEPEKAFYEQVWFFVVVAVGGVILVVLIIAVVCGLVCCRVVSKTGKTYIRTNSSMSGASSGFSEYQHKKSRVGRNMPHVRVHSSPTPSRRTTDYADMESLGLRSQNGPPSIGYADSLLSGLTEQSQGHFPPLTEHPAYPHHQETRMMGGSSQEPNGMISPDSYDHIPVQNNQPPAMSMGVLHGKAIELPPPPPFADPPKPSNPTSTYPAREGRASLSQDSDASWNPTENLNFRGHMSNKGSGFMNSNSSIGSASGGGETNRPMQNGFGSQASSAMSLEQRVNKGHLESPSSHIPGHSRQSSTGRSQLSQLPPLHEHIVGEQPASSDQSQQQHVYRGQRGSGQNEQVLFYSASAQSVNSRTSRQHQNTRPIPTSEQPSGHQFQFQDMNYLHDTHSQSQASTSPPSLGEMDFKESYAESRQNSHHTESRFSPEQIQPPNIQQHQGKVYSQQNMPEIVNQWQEQKDFIPYHPTDPPLQGLHHQGPSSSSQQFLPSQPLSQQHSNHTSAQHLGQALGQPQLPYMDFIHNPIPMHSHSQNLMPIPKPKPLSVSAQQLNNYPPTHSLPNGRGSSTSRSDTIPDVIQNPGQQNRGMAVPPQRPMQVGSLEASKPRIKQTKVPREIWKPKPMTGAIASSSESDSDDSIEESVVGDNTSLKSAYV